jgi:hypothetical protein
MEYVRTSPWSLLSSHAVNDPRTLDSCLEHTNRSLHVIFIGDSNSALQHQMFDRFFSRSKLPLKTTKIQPGGGGLFVSVKNTIEQLRELALVEATDYFVIFNAGLHDIMFCEQQWQKDRAPLFRPDANFSCAELYRESLTELVTAVAAFPARLRVWQTTTAGWPKWGNYGFAWPADYQSLPKDPTAVAHWNEVAWEVLQPFSNEIAIMDAYWLTLSRPDHRELGSIGKHLAHAGPQVYSVLMRKWAMLILQSICPSDKSSSSSLTVTTRTATTTIANTTRSASTSTSATPLSSPLVSYPWQWIHPTKTGTSFANVLYMLGCPEDYSANWTESELDYHTTHPKLGIRNASLECKQRWKHGKGYDETQGKGYDWGKTRPLRPRWWLGEHAYRNPSLPDEQLFMTLRDPVDRMISQLFFKRQTNAKTDSEIAQAILQNKRFNSTHFAHHMTSFLFPLAKQQHHSGSLESLTKKACQVVQNMAWVGFVDDFERSVCLLHSRFHFPHHPVEMMNNRPTAGRNKQINVTAVGILVRKQSTILDDGVYNCARERFHRELEQWAPHCI